MIKYPAIVEGVGSDYGIVFPDLPGIVAMGDTVDQVIQNAEEALRDYAIESKRDGLPLATPSAPENVEVPSDCTLTSIRLAQ